MRYQRLTLPERYQIMALCRRKLSIRAIAFDLNRSPSTISRELSRNGYIRQSYCPINANKGFLRRRSRIHAVHKINGSLLNDVVARLNEQWSPEQIAGRLRTISHETIYKFVYKESYYGGKLYRNLRRNRKRRRSHKITKAYRNCGKRLGYPSMRLRPSIVNQRLRLGDYERDTVLGKFNGPVLLTIVDRSSRLTKIKKLPWINAAATHKQTVNLLKGRPVHTITNDNGPEFADYRKTSIALRGEIFFNDPYSSWQRGTNENTNGLIRQYYPKGTNFELVSDEEIQRIEDRLNNRPRKCLGFKTPLEVQNDKIRGVALRA